MKIVTCIICEDIRQELGNKHSLMGVYDDAIIFQITPDKIANWPKSKPLSFFIRLSTKPEDNLADLTFLTIESNLDGSDISEIVRLAVDYQPKTTKMNFAISIGSFIFKNKGNLSFSLKFYDKDKKLLSEINNFYKLRIDESANKSVFK